MTYDKQDPVSIQQMFSHIANRYDRANAIMSFNLHHFWNRTLTNTVLSHKFPEKYLDLCAGTGEIAGRFLKKLHDPCEVFMLDFSDKMLECAKEKLNKIAKPNQHLHYLHADALQIPLPGESIDAVTVAYGIRNVKDTSKCCAEVNRVLKKDGIFAILELTQPQNFIMKYGHSLYLKFFLPLFGGMVTSNKEAYQYLHSSVQSFISPDKLEIILQKQGYRDTKTISLCGGIASIILGYK